MPKRRVQLFINERALLAHQGQGRPALPVAQGDQTMIDNSVVRARIDGKTKAEAAAVL
jgi:hypothetical protein